MADIVVFEKNLEFHKNFSGKEKEDEEIKDEENNRGS